MMSTPKKE